MAVDIYISIWERKGNAPKERPFPLRSIEEIRVNLSHKRERERERKRESERERYRERGREKENERARERFPSILDPFIY